MTREEALQAIKAKMDYYESDKRLRAAIETLIPELRESEDERIRKELVETIKLSENGPVYLSEQLRESYLTWLEKQKENPKNADSIPADCVSDVKYEDRWHKTANSLPDNGREVLAKDKLGNILLARYDGEGWDVSVYDNDDYRCHIGISKWCEIPSEKQKEHQNNSDAPNESSWSGIISPSDKDKNLDEIAQDYVEAVKEYNPEPTWNLMQTAVCYGYHLAEQKEQKPVEIHIDNPNIQKVDPDVEITTSDSSASGKELLYVSNKSYQLGRRDGKMEAQKPAEWSEEDKRKLNRIYEILGYAADDKGFLTSKRIIGDREAIELQDFLKSLRPSWKPSEEQMEALQNAVALTACDKELARLYEQLKSFQ